MHEDAIWHPAHNKYRACYICYDVKMSGATVKMIPLTDTSSYILK